MIRFAAGLCLVLALLAPVAFPIDVDLAYVEDITELTGECFIRAIKLDRVESPDEEETNVRTLAGELTLAEGAHAVEVRTAGGDTPELWVDRDGTDVLAQAEWERVLVDGTLLASVQMDLTYEDGRAPYRIFLMWNSFLPTVLTFCRGSYREGTMDIDEREVRLAVVDADTDGRYDLLDGGVLLIDTDGDGELLATGDSHERFFLDEPFNVDGVTYIVESVSPVGDRLALVEAVTTVPPKVPLLPGYEAPGFSWEDEAEETVQLESLSGRVVVLDFWAGWCGPCVAEMPTLKRLLETYVDEPVTLLGINLDRGVDAFETAVVDLGIDWPQIYDGSNGPIGALFRIEGIPMTYLIDAEGVIVARGLRGQALIDAVGEELADLEEPEEAQNE